MIAAVSLAAAVYMILSANDPVTEVQSRDQDEEQSASLTIEFKAGNGLALVTTQEDKESLTDQLAARKAAVEGMGE